MAPSTSLPRHPITGLYALGFTSRGPIWPVMGGDESEDAAAQAAAAQAAAEQAATDAAAAERAAAERGFPAETPVSEMTAPQQAAYWKHQARQHEGRVKALGVTPDEVKALRDKAARADQLEYDLASDKDKAVADAKKAAEQEAAAKARPQIVAAKLEAAAARKGVDEASLTKALQFVDSSKFLTDQGEIDADKVTDFIQSIAPGMGNQQQQQRRGPGSDSQGRRAGAPGEKSVASGADLYAQLHPKKAS